MLQIIKYIIRRPNILNPIVLQHSRASSICETLGEVKGEASSTGTKPVCSERSKGKGGDADGGKGLKRAKVPGKCRMGFIPEEWFLFLRPMTGVSGPYILMINLANYVASKEILVMEHEYYLGLSVFIVLYLVSTRLGPTIGTALDKEVDAVANELESARQAEIDAMATQIKNAKTAIWRAEGQKELMDAKKENVAIQLEAIYRERQMMVHQGVRRRLEFHVKQHWATRRIKHKWMVQWVLENVHKGITPEFKKQVMEIAIRDLTALADKYEASAKK